MNKHEAEEWMDTRERIINRALRREKRQTVAKAENIFVAILGVVVAAVLTFRFVLWCCE